MLMDGAAIQKVAFDFGIFDPQSHPEPEHEIKKSTNVNNNDLFWNQFQDIQKITTPNKMEEKLIAPIIPELDVSIKEINEETPYDICSYCNIRLKITEEVMVCTNCGIEKDLLIDYCPETYNAAIDSNYNSSTTASVSFTFSGKNSYGYQKAMLKTCSDYSTVSHQTIKKEILNRINMYKGNKPPMNVQLNCVELYCSIKENDKSYLNIINNGVSEQNEKKRLVFRSNGKWGIIAACLYYSCIEEGLSRTPREISEIIGIDEKYQSAGDKKLQEFHELGIINIAYGGNTILNDYINRYFPLLEIPDKYKEFISDLIKRADKKGLHICNENRTSTKCIGAIYVLCMRLPELKHNNRDRMAKECKMSKTTFTRYAMILMNNWPLLKKVFKKHCIPMPKEWKSTK
jgi:transcription initiation factor TFIIIB Brf1 subunit/transcription initiation factor TFIIB